MQKDEIKIVKRVLRGEVDAFGDIVERYQEMVYRVCLRFMKEEQEAMDMAQEVFLKAYNNLSKFNFKSSFSTWLYRICANTCLNRLKKLQKLKIELSPELLNECGFSAPEDILELKEIIELIENELDNMDKTSGSIVKLRLFGQRSFREIAGLLNIPGSTARTYFTRSKKRLQESISDFRKE